MTEPIPFPTPEHAPDDLTRHEALEDELDDVLDLLDELDP